MASAAHALVVTLEHGTKMGRPRARCPTFVTIPARPALPSNSKQHSQHGPEEDWDISASGSGFGLCRLLVLGTLDKEALSMEERNVHARKVPWIGSSDVDVAIGDLRPLKTSTTQRQRHQHRHQHPAPRHSVRLAGGLVGWWLVAGWLAEGQRAKEADGGS